MEYKNKGNFEAAQEELRNDKNNAVASIFDVENKNDGILKDVVFTLKNNYAKKFDSTDASSNILTGFNPGYNATILNKLNKYGAKIVATTNLDEFGLGGTGEYSNRGLVKNPLNNDYYVGGSSSGSAATFTKNIGFAVGSDTGDSVRLPASNIGVVGFKPSYGAVSRYGLFSYASSMDTVAWFTHNVNDSIILSQVLYGRDKMDLTSIDVKINNVILSKPKKVAILNCFDNLEDYVAISYKELIEKLKKDGVEVEIIEPNVELLNVVKTVYEVISFSEASSNLSNLTGVGFGVRKDGKDWEEIFKNTRSEGFGLMVKRRLALGSYFLEKQNQEEYFLRSQKVRRLIANWFNSIYDKYDFLIYPSSPSIAPKFNEKVNNEKYKYMSYILTASNLVGSPSICMKLGTHNNMPFNISIDAKIYEDEKLLSTALYLEKLIGENND